MQTRNLKYRIYGFEVRCAALISYGLMNGKSKPQIMRMLQKELRRFQSTVNLSKAEVNRLWLTCIYEYRTVSKKVWGNRNDPEKVYLAIKKTLPVLESTKNIVGRNIEARKKTDYLVDLKGKGIFYLCSYHIGAAKDHKDFQGKIYVSEDWENRCSSDEQRYKVGSYIKNHKCLTLEYIIDKPVYMCTRPNCRHYFKEIPVNEVLHSSVKKMLKQHGMINHQMELTYEYLMYRKYYERLKVLMSLRNICECDKLENDIRYVRKKIKKWLSKLNR